MVEDLPAVCIYTDGAAEPNPGPGGYGVVLQFGEHRKELSAGYQLTTNNRMELLAVIIGVEALTKPCRVCVYSDSKYVVDAVEKGAVFRWRSNDWRRTKTRKTKNSDLWERFITVYDRHSVTLGWVPGHQGVAENERCDQLAVGAAKSDDLLPDTGYEPSDDSPDAETGSSTKSEVTHIEPGEACRKCGSPLIKQMPKHKKRKPRKSYYYEWYLYCTGCKTMYMVESAKHQCDDSGSMFDEAS